MHPIAPGLASRFNALRHTVRPLTVSRVALGAAVAVVMISARPARADYQVLHSFTGGSTDGWQPSGALTASGSLLYGMTTLGGADGWGSIVQYNPATQTTSLAYSFAGGYADGGEPRGSLISSGSVLYGMTSVGGDSARLNNSLGKGTLFQYNTQQHTFSLLHSFMGGASDGAGPQGTLAQSGTTLYGTTAVGGAHNKGALFAYDTSASTFTLLYSFAGSTDGDLTSAMNDALLVSGSRLYGVTGNTLFQYDVANQSFSTLHRAAVGERFSPVGSLVQSGTLLYGMTLAGGDHNRGAIYQYDTTSGQYETLYSFAGGSGDGDTPIGSLILSGDILYGLTSSGGSTPQSVDGNGTVFAFDTTTDQLTLLHAFADANDGRSPWDHNSLTQVGSELFGMTEQGGTDGMGTIFSLSVPEPGAFVATGLLLLAGLARPRRRAAATPA